MPRALCGRTALWSLRHEVMVSSASSSDSKTCAFRHSARSRALNDSTRVVRRLLWAAEFEPHILSIGPRIQGTRSELGPVVHLDDGRLPIRPRQPVEHVDHATDGPRITTAFRRRDRVRLKFTPSRRYRRSVRLWLTSQPSRRSSTLIRGEPQLGRTAAISLIRIRRSPCPGFAST